MATSWFADDVYNPTITRDKGIKKNFKEKLCSLCRSHLTQYWIGMEMNNKMSQEQGETLCTQQIIMWLKPN